MPYPFPVIRAGNASYSPSPTGQIPYESRIVELDGNFRRIYRIHGLGVASENTPDIVAAIDGPNLLTGSTYRLESRAKVKTTQLDFVFDGTRTGSEYANLNAWTQSRLNLAAVRLNDSDNNAVTLVKGFQTQLGNGEYVPSSWQHPTNSSIYINFEYDGNGLLTLVEAHHGQALTLVYTEQVYGASNENTTYHLTSITNSCESCPSYTYEYSGTLLTKVKDADNTTVVAYDYASYDETGGPVITKAYRRSGTTDFNMYEAVYNVAANKVTHYNYQTASVKQAVIDEFKDDFGTLTKRQYYHDTTTGTPSGANDSVTYDYAYDGASTKLTKVDVAMPRSNTHRWILRDYDAGVNLVTKHLEIGDGSITKAAYTYGSEWEDVRWPTTVATDVRGGETEYSYSYGNQLLLTKTIDPQFSSVLQGSMRHTTEYGYDNKYQLTRLTRRTSANQAVYTDYAYDEFGHATLEIENAGGSPALTSQYTYDSAGRRRTSQDPRGIKRVSSYSSGGSLLREYTLDAGGSDAVELTIYEFDHLGRVTKQRQAASDGAISSPESYNGTTIDTRYLYDVFGRRTGVVSDSGGLNLTTAYEYDNLDRVAKVTTPGGIFTQVDRDGRGRRIRQIIGASGGNNLTTTYEYDSNSNLTQVTEPNGVISTYEYDLFDRRTKAVRSTS